MDLFNTQYLYIFYSFHIFISSIYQLKQISVTYLPFILIVDKNASCIKNVINSFINNIINKTFNNIINKTINNIINKTIITLLIKLLITLLIVLV